MRLPFSGLRAGILVELIFLIIAAMLLVNVVMIKFSERDLIDAVTTGGIIMIGAVEQNIRNYLSQNKDGLGGLGTDAGRGQWARERDCGCSAVVEMSGSAGQSGDGRCHADATASVKPDCARWWGLLMVREGQSAGAAGGY